MNQKSETPQQHAVVHTPGPWAVERRWSNGCEIVPRIVCKPDDDRGCGWIADIIGAPYLGHESTLPNARLIAAAPELLEACKAAVVVLAGIRCRSVAERDLLQEIHDKLWSAVVKARSVV